MCCPSFRLNVSPCVHEVCDGLQLSVVVTGTCPGVEWFDVDGTNGVVDVYLPAYGDVVESCLACDPAYG